MPAIIAALSCSLLALATLGLSGCGTAAPPEPAPDAGPPVAEGFERFDGRWYTVDLPAAWIERPLVGERQKMMFDRELGADEGAPDIKVLVARPRPVKSSVKDGAPPEAMAAGLGAKASPATTVGADQLLGGPATRAVTKATSNTGEGAWFAMWMTVRDGHLIVVDCGGSGAGSAEAEKLCPQVVASFRLAGDLPAPAARLPAEGATWETRSVGPLSVQTPREWEGLAQEWLDGRQAGGFRRPFADRGPYEIDQITVAFHQKLGGVEPLLLALDASASFHTLGRTAVVSPFGPATRTDQTDQITRRIVLDAVGSGLGVEIVCDVPERVVDVAEGYCEHVFDTVGVVAQAPRGKVQPHGEGGPGASPGGGHGNGDGDGSAP